MEKKSRELAKMILSIPRKSTIAIFPHIGVDGDCLGSTLALKFALEQLGMNVLVITNETVPAKFFFFPRINEITVFPSQQEPEALISFLFSQDTLDIGILVDCSSPMRIGECNQIYKEAELKIVLDHHFTSSCEEEHCIVDAMACASGEIIYNLVSSIEKESGIKIFNMDIATSIMAAILADTGGFRYSNTNKEAFGIAHDLFTKFPINLRDLTYHLFEKTSISRVRLQGKAYEAAIFHFDNRIVACPINQSMIESCHALEGDVDGICSDLKNVEGVMVAFVLRERTSGEIRVNIRSSNEFDASSFAAYFGGGGHMRAAGCTLTGLNLQEAHRVIVEKSIEILNETIKM